jgi:hypothetical protein
MKSAGLGLGLIVGVLVLIWLGTGFFIVQEGQQAVVTRFGRYNSTVGAGFNWRLPYPIQRHESWSTSRRSARSTSAATPSSCATGLRESAMLTEDENIVEIKFAVQYRLKRRARLPVREQEPRRGRGAGGRDGGARGGRQDAHGLGAGRRARPDRPARAQADAAPSSTATRSASRSWASTCSRAACVRPSRCRPPSTTCSRPARSASAPRTKPRPMPTTSSRVRSVRPRA